MDDIRILALMEAASLTGPAKNLIAFGRWLSSDEGRPVGMDLSIATFDRDSRVDQPDGFVAEAARAGLQTHILQERRRFDPGVLPQLHKLIESVDPHIIQTHNNKSHLLVRLASRSRENRLWFAFHHGDAYTNLRQRFYNHIDRFSLRDADRVITVCDAFGRRLIRTGVPPGHLRILHNSAVPPPALTSAERLALRGSLGATEDQALILAVGRLSSEKGHADLIQALGHLRMIERRWRTVFVGDGPEHAALVRLADKLGIADRILFAGFRGDAARLCQAADIFALPSHSEGSSNALLEAMSAKLAIVATVAGGNSEILESERTALLVPVRRPAEMASALARLIVDPAYTAALGDAAFRQVAETYSPSQYRERLCSYYQEALVARPGRPSRGGSPA
jgi:glycosyltransferase involved in cell wall biosynthesis